MRVLGTRLANVGGAMNIHDSRARTRASGALVFIIGIMDRSIIKIVEGA
jgi:hypothetical protein